MYFLCGMEENKKGGKRINSGRKPLSDPKKPITLYVPKSKILLNGGDEKLKLRIYDVISRDFTTPLQSATEVSQSIEKVISIVEPRKSVQEWIGEKREILVPELYEDFIDKLNRTKYLSEAEKKQIRLA